MVPIPIFNYLFKIFNYLKALKKIVYSFMSIIMVFPKLNPYFSGLLTPFCHKANYNRLHFTYMWQHRQIVARHNRTKKLITWKVARLQLTFLCISVTPADGVSHSSYGIPSSTLTPLSLRQKTNRKWIHL